MLCPPRMMRSFLGGTTSIPRTSRDLRCAIPRCSRLPRIRCPIRASLEHRGMAQRKSLDVRGIDVVPPANDEILLAADDLEVAAFVHAPEVAAQEPAARVERAFRRGLVVEIAE